MRKIGFIVLSIYLLAISSCLTGQEKIDISLEEVMSIGGADSGEIFQWAGLCVDDKGAIYITDMVDYSIKKFNKNGKLLKKSGRKGQGPGEFLKPINIYNYKDNIYVLDLYVRGVQVFDTSLVYKNSMFTDLNIPINDFSIINSDRFIFNSQVGSGNLYIYDKKGREITKLNYFKEKSDNKYFMSNSIGFFDIDRTKNIYIAFFGQDLLMKLTSTGKIRWKKNLFRGKKSKRKTISKISVITETCYKSVSIDTSGNVFILGGDIAKESSKTIFVLSPKGELISIIVLDETTHMIYIDRENYLYSRAGQGVCIKKYKINYRHM